NMVAKVYNLYAMNHPDVAKAAAAHLLEMAKHAQQNDQIRAVDVEYLEACLELCSNMWTHYSNAQGKPAATDIAAERVLLGIEEDAWDLNNQVAGEHFSKAEALANKIETAAASDYPDWVLFANAARDVVTLGNQQDFGPPVISQPSTH
ncbi:MAG TPA: hypothetical protein VK034_12505, partial [Enhygromyxa sp.]|nr:hypothetical protein [Enhygromyxa sp.]